MEKINGDSPRLLQAAGRISPPQDDISQTKERHVADGKMNVHRHSGVIVVSVVDRTYMSDIYAPLPVRDMRVACMGLLKKPREARPSRGE